MALIKCPECGKEISDKATACIHCGYPIASVNDNADVEVNGITEVLTRFGFSYSSGSKAIDIYQDVLNEVVKVKSANNEKEANDIVAKSMIDGLAKIPQYLSLLDVKLFCELINFANLSADAMDYFANQLYTIVSIYKTHSDGSGGYSYLTQFFYPEYMVMQYASPSIRSKYMAILSKPYFGKQTGYDYITSLYRQYAGTSTVSQIEITRQRNEGIKCPMCGSKNVSKISTTGRLFSVATFGLASSKIGKQYECNNCKHKW